MSTSSDKYFLRPSCNVFIFLFCAIILFATPFPVKAYGSPDQIKKTITDLSSLGDRSFGSEGAKKAADYIENEFKALGNFKVGRQLFLAPSVISSEAKFSIGDNKKISIKPAKLNAISPPATPQKGLTGPVIYVGKGRLGDFNGLPVKDAIVLMDMDSEKTG